MAKKTFTKVWQDRQRVFEKTELFSFSVVTYRKKTIQCAPNEYFFSFFAFDYICLHALFGTQARQNVYLFIVRNPYK